MAIVLNLRPAFKRIRTFQWFVTTLAGITVREDMEEKLLTATSTSANFPLNNLKKCPIFWGTPMKYEEKTDKTNTEKLLSELCNDTFLDLWSFPNPFNEDRKEFCDLIAVFNNEIFIFFDRERVINSELNGDVTSKEWSRWRRKVIVKQIQTVIGAERYLMSGRNIYCDKLAKKKLPIIFNIKNACIHKIIVAHGASIACKNFSDENKSGSLAINYSSDPDKMEKGDFLSFSYQQDKTPFFVDLNKDDLIHVFDSENLEIIFKNLDTFHEFSRYILEKELAIKKLSILEYLAEEDLLAHYFYHFDKKQQRHFILSDSETPQDNIYITEGAWTQFCQNDQYKRKMEENKISYLWDNLIKELYEPLLQDQRTGDRVFDFNSNHPIKEMAKEPRFVRRGLSQHLSYMLNSFNEEPSIPINRKVRHTQLT